MEVKRSPSSSKSVLNSPNRILLAMGKKSNNTSIETHGLTTTTTTTTTASNITDAQNMSSPKIKEVSPQYSEGSKKHSNTYINVSKATNKTSEKSSFKKRPDKRRAKLKERGLVQIVDIESFKKFNLNNVFHDGKKQTTTCKCLIF